MRHPMTSPAALAAGMAEVRPQSTETTRAFDRQGFLAIEPQALGLLFAEYSSDEPFDREGDLAVVEIEGPLAQHDGWWFDSYDAIRKRCDAAFASDAKAVLLKIDSPGGEVAGCFELCDHLIAKKTEAGKPLYAYADGSATSAAYALACCADEVYAPATGRLGSIGVISSWSSLSAMAKALGIDVAVITSGKRKADGHPMLPITDEAKAAAQARVNELAGIFVAHVAEQRGVAPENVAALEAGVLLGGPAMAAGLCDAVLTYDEVIAKHGGAVAPEGSALGGYAAQAASAETHTPADGQSVVATDGVVAPPERKSLMDKAILMALGCAEDASETAALAAATKLSGDNAALLGALEAKTVDEAQGTIAALKANKAALESAKAEAEALRAQAIETERDALIAKHSDPGGAECKIAPTQVEWAKSLPLETLKGFLSAAPSIVSAPSALPKEPAHAIKLTPAQRRAAETAGVSEADFAADLAKLEGGE